MTRGYKMPPIACALWAALGLCGGPGGCSSDLKPDLESPVPSARIAAMGEASGRHDPKEIRGLIAQLDSDDPAVRVFAIASLEKITGRREGYDPADAERTRREAVDRWEGWYREEYGVGGENDRWKEREGGEAGGSGTSRGGEAQSPGGAGVTDQSP